MNFKEGDILGKVIITYTNIGEYSINTSFHDNVFEMLFFIFFLDKVLTECENEKNSQNLLANVLGYVKEEERIESQMNLLFGNYKKVSILSYDKDFAYTSELISKKVAGGVHWYIWTTISLKSVSNIDGKFGFSTLLYTIDLCSRLSEQEKEFLGNITTALYYEYANVSMPSLRTLTAAPTKVLNFLINDGHISNKYMFL